MPQSSGQQSPQPSTSDFGANEWLVEEMRERYKADPSSVDASWADYFSNGSGDGTAAKASNSTVKTEPKRPPGREDRAEGGAEGRAKSRRPSEDGGEGQSEAKPQPKAEPRQPSKAAEPAKGTTNPMPKESRPVAPAAASDEPTYTVLRGAPARTAHEHGRLAERARRRPPSARCR